MGWASDSSGSSSSSSSKKKGSWASSSGGGESKKSGGGGLMDALKGIIGGGKELGAKVLEIADLPRAAVLEGGVNLANAIRGEDLKDFGEMGEAIGKHRGVGDLIKDADLPGGINTKRVLGFAGDVATDPLTYATFGASAVVKPVLKEAAEAGLEQAVKGASKGIRLNKEQVVTRLAKEGKYEAAEAVARSGIATGAKGFSDDLAEAGIEYGARLGGKRIPGSEKAVAAIGAEKDKLMTRLRDSKLGGATRDALGGRMGAVTTQLRKTPGGAALAVALKTADDLARAEARSIKDQGVTSLGKLVKDLGDDLDKDDLRGALEGSGAVTSGAVEARALMDNLRERAIQITGKYIPRLDDYLPHRLTNEARDALGGAAKKGKPSNGEILQRFYKAGDEFFGQVLKTGSIDEINGIAKNHIGKLFKDDPVELMHRYITEISKFTEKHGRVKRFGDAADAMSPNATEAMAKAAAKASGKADKLAEKLRPITERLQTVGAEKATREGFAGDYAAKADKLAGKAGKAETFAEGAENAAAQAEATAATATRGLDELVEPPAAPEAIKPSFDTEAHNEFLFNHPDALTHVTPAHTSVPAGYEGIIKEVEVPEKTHFIGTFAQDKYLGLIRKTQNFLDQDALASYLGKDLHSVKAGGEGIQRTLAEVSSNPEYLKAMDNALERLGVKDKVLIYRGGEGGGEFLNGTLDPRTAGGKFTKEGEAMHGFLVNRSDIVGFGDTYDAEVFVRASGAKEVFSNSETAIDPLLEAQARQAKILGRQEWEEGATPSVREITNRMSKLEAEIPEAELATDAVKATFKDADPLDAEAAIGKVEGAAAAKKTEHALLGAEKDALTMKAKGQKPVDPGVVTAAFVKQTDRVMGEAKDFDHATAVGRSDYAKRAQELRDEVRTHTTTARGNQAEAQVARDRAASLYEKAAGHKAAGEDELGKIAALEAEAVVLTAKLAKGGDEIAALRKMATDADTMQTARSMMENGLRELSDGRYGSPEVADALTQIDELFKPETIKGLVKAYDAMTSRWRAYALLSPGYHGRNTFGGMFNNWLAGMRTSAYRDYTSYAHTIKRGGELSDVVRKGNVASPRQAWKAMEEMGAIEKSNVMDLSDVVNGSPTNRGIILGVPDKFDPTSLDNKLLKANAAAAQGVERNLRAPLFLDTFMRTGDKELALSKVMEFHFDYADLSKFEQKYVKRATGFYTWTRKNFGLQIQQFMTQPGKYTRYTHAQRNLQLGVPEDETVPSYYGELMAIRLPFTKKGNRVYATPDLPFIGLTKTLQNPFSQLNPYLKVPLESITNTNSFEQRPFSTKLKGAPSTWGPLLRVLQVADGNFGLPKVYTASDGSLMMNEQSANKIEGLLPVLGRARRLVPNEEKYQDRITTSWLSFVFGIGTRTLDPASIQGEIKRREFDAKDAKTRAKQLRQG